MVNPLHAAVLTKNACEKRGVRLDALIAETAMWAYPAGHHRQIAQAGTAAFFPTIRRARPGQGEKRGFKDGIRLDDNNYANVAIKRALGHHRTKIIGFETCQVWPKTCYDCRYHTAIPNLVLIPRALAGLTDQNRSDQAALQHRSYELYGWHPEGVTAPERPADYPSNWLEPQPDPGEQGSRSGPPKPSPDPVDPRNDGALPIERIRRWASRPQLAVHSIIAIAHARGPSPRDQLVKELDEYKICENPYGSIASLMTNVGNAYGRVFVEEAGRLVFHPDLRDEIQRHHWQLPDKPLT